jgi:hypothetical protein
MSLRVESAARHNAQAGLGPFITGVSIFGDSSKGFRVLADFYACRPSDGGTKIRMQGLLLGQ